MLGLENSLAHACFPEKHALSGIHQHDAFPKHEQTRHGVDEEQPFQKPPRPLCNSHNGSEERAFYYSGRCRHSSFSGASPETDFLKGIFADFRDRFAPTFDDERSVDGYCETDADEAAVSVVRESLEGLLPGKSGFVRTVFPVFSE